MFFYSWKNLVFPIGDWMNDEIVKRQKEKNYGMCDERTLFINTENIEIKLDGVEITVTRDHIHKALQFSSQEELIFKEGDKILFPKVMIIIELFKYCFFKHIQLPQNAPLSDCHIYVSIPSKVLFKERELFRNTISSVSGTKNVYLVKEAVALSYYFHYHYGTIRIQG